MTSTSSSSPKPGYILWILFTLLLKHPSPTSLAYYNNLKNLHRKAISTTKASHIIYKVDKLANDSKSINRISTKLLGRSLKALSPLSPLKNYDSSSRNISMINFPQPFPPFPPLSVCLLHGVLHPWRSPGLCSWSSHV